MQQSWFQVLQPFILYYRLLFPKKNINRITDGKRPKITSTVFL